MPHAFESLSTILTALGALPLYPLILKVMQSYRSMALNWISGVCANIITLPQPGVSCEFYFLELMYEIAAPVASKDSGSCNSRLLPAFKYTCGEDYPERWRIRQYASPKAWWWQRRAFAIQSGELSYQRDAYGGTCRGFCFRRSGGGQVTARKRWWGDRGGRGALIGWHSNTDFFVSLQRERERKGEKKNKARNQGSRWHPHTLKNRCAFDIEIQGRTGKPPRRTSETPQSCRLW